MLTDIKFQVEPNDIFVKFLKESPEIKSKMISLGYTVYQDCKQIVSGWDKTDYQEQLRILQDKITEKSKQLTLLHSRHSEEISEISQQVKERTLSVYQHECKEKQEKCERLEKQLNDIQITLLKQHQETMDKRIEELRSQYDKKLEEERSKNMKIVTLKENSSMKGQEGEEFTFHQLNLLFPTYTVEDTHKDNARGDFLVKNEKYSMMVEAKKYSKNVPLVEIEKFHRDMALEINKDVDCGVLISLDSGICAKEDFSIEFVGGKPVIYLHHTRNQMEHIQLAFTLFKIILRQEGLDTNMETAITVFKGLAKKLKRNYKKQKTIIDKYHAEQLKNLVEQQEHIIELYNHVGIHIEF